MSARTAVWLTLVGTLHAAPALAQFPPVIVPTDPNPGFLTRYVAGASLEALSLHEQDFYWDADIGLGLDVADFGWGRAHVAFGYEIVMGNQLQPFDPWQGNYSIDVLGWFRQGGGEWGVLFRHVSRHLGDRRKDFGIAWNDLGAQWQQQWQVGRWTWQPRAAAVATVSRGYVDYRAAVGGDLVARRTLSGRYSLIGSAATHIRFVTRSVAMRDAQVGARIEAGLRVDGRNAALEFVGGWERRIDADPLDFTTRQWAFAGMRIVSR